MRTRTIGLIATAFAMLFLAPGSAFGVADPAKPLISNAADVSVDYAPKCTNLRANGGRCFWWNAANTAGASATFSIRGRTKVCMNDVGVAVIQINEVITPTVSLAPPAAILDGSDCLFLYAGVYWLEISTQDASVGPLVVSLVEDLD